MTHETNSSFVFNDKEEEMNKAQGSSKVEIQPFKVFQNEFI